MLKRKAAAIVLVFTTAAAFGTSIELVQIPYERPAQALAYDIDTFEAEGWATYDLAAHIDANDSWLWADVELCVGNSNGNVFWEHPTGGNATPRADDMQFFGLFAYDSFWTSPEEWPNVDLVPGLNAMGFTPGNPRERNPGQRVAERNVDPTESNVDGGDYTITRVTAPESTLICATGTMYYESLGGAGHHFYNVPFPMCGCGEQCPGDFTFDSRAALDDLAILLAYYGDTTAAWNHGDMDEDEDVDLERLSRVFSALRE